MEFTKIEEYHLKLNFKELRTLKELVRIAAVLTSKEEFKPHIELSEEAIMFAKDICNL